MAVHALTLFRRSQSSDPALTNAYPTALSAAESIYYGGGSTARSPLQVITTKAAVGGASIVLKAQGAVLPVDGACYAVRGPGTEQGLLQVWAKTGDFYTVRLQQRTGISQAIATSATGTGGLDLALLVSLPTDINGSPSGTPAAVAAAINLLADFEAVASGPAAPLGILGTTLDNRPAGRVHWNDITSLIQNVEAVEHTVAAAAGGQLEVALDVPARHYVALRVLAKGAAAPAGGDSVVVLAANEGA